MKYQVILIVLYKSSSCQAEGNTAIDFVLHSVAQSLLADNCPDGWNYNSTFGKCYKLFAAEEKWPMSEIVCAFRGAHHVSIHNKLENNYIKKMVTSQSSSDNLWLGAAQFGTSKEYEWSDHTPFNFENWETKTRPPYTKAKRCTKMNLTTGKWYQSCCKIPSPYICQRPAGVVTG
ncbi:unnamed protein product [Dracunculus medinensis]|uniref:C-type lectin domain-containing protein n=1 Tax=Dracunculus medinensis TaxID=318479 RepID=A0A0N4UGR2_DRAME|nr:unnamed protein product [Dracunculus medinensis]